MIYPGTLNRHQGVDIAIRAFARAAARMPDAEFHIYGEGPELSALTRLVHDVGLGARVQIRARLPLMQISSVMAQADVGVVPKRASGFGNEAFSTKTLEFMACRVPVIVSKTAVDAYYFSNELVRFFVAEDEASLAEALVEVYDGRGGHSAWIERAHAFAVQHSWQQRAADYRRVVTSLTDGEGRTSAAATPEPIADWSPNDDAQR